MSSLILIVCFAFAGPIAGVPNDLRREFKSVHHFPELDIKLGSQTVKARMDLNGDNPVLVYNVLRGTRPNEILNKFIHQKFPRAFRIVESKNKNLRQREFNLWINDRPVLNAWVKMQPSDDKHNAFALNLPITDQVIYFDDQRGNEKLQLHNGRIVEYREETYYGHKKIVFAEKSLLPKRIQVALKPVWDQKADTERIQLPKGSFPDQIVADENGLLWFTQPSDALLTSFNVRDNLWFHQPVGAGADGLYMDWQGSLWFGEYESGHMGFYDPKANIYKRWEIPYAASAPAIPFRDKGSEHVWLTDHQNNKIDILNLSTDQWKILEVPTPKAWPVQIFKESVTGSMIVTECYANKLGKIDPETYAYSEIELGVSSCPAFATEAHAKVWTSLWSYGAFLSYDVISEEITEYVITFDDEQSERGFGPIQSDSQGNIYIGSLSDGRIYRFDPSSQKLTYVKGVGGLKDGITITSDGHVWATEMFGGLFHADFH